MDGDVQVHCKRARGAFRNNCKEIAGRHGNRHRMPVRQNQNNGTRVAASRELIIDQAVVGMSPSSVRLRKEDVLGQAAPKSWMLTSCDTHQLVR
jgi:hypothetical protein